MRYLCPICDRELETGEKTWRCPAGHSFDVARQGYVNLLPVQQKHSAAPGDSAEQVRARRSFLQKGFYAPVAETLSQLAGKEKTRSVLDVGCGEGYYLRELKKRLPLEETVGVDISRDAVRLAAGADKESVYLTATASHLPLADASADLVTSLFALTVAEEFHRVLAPGGRLLLVTAGREHLLALRRLIYREVFEREEKKPEVFTGFRLEEEKTLEFSFTLENKEDIQALLGMTPHVKRISAEGAARAAAAEILRDQAQVCFRVYRRLA